MIYVSPRKLSSPRKHPFRAPGTDITLLTAHIRDNGILHPITCDMKAGKLIVLDGFLRLRAARKLKMKEIPIALRPSLEALYVSFTPDNIWRALQCHSVEKLSEFLGVNPDGIRKALMQ